jgi:GTP-binding protein
VKFGKNRQHIAPSGGDGGDGGNIILQVDSSINTLMNFRARNHFKAENGYDGNCDYQTGKKGSDLYIPVPNDVLVKDNVTGEIITELNKNHPRYVVAKGGLGGKGNAAMNAKGEKGTATPAQGMRPHIDK